MNSCWMAPDSPLCFAQLGKYGDVMIILPGFKAIYDETGVPPVCIVAQQFADIFDGISYAEPIPVKLNWWKELGVAVAIGKSRFGHCIAPKYWDIPNAKSPVPLTKGPTVTIRVQGRPIVMPAEEWDSYQSSQWRAAGFTMEQMHTWPLVFDRRDAEREQALRDRTFKTDQPKILVNLSIYGSSPFRNMNDVVPMLPMDKFEIVDLSQVKAHRIYDLLGLYDYAAGLVTSDTSTLHLASASTLPYIAFIADGGSGSVPRGNCILSMRYRDIQTNRLKIKKAIEAFEHDYRRLADNLQGGFSRKGYSEDNARVACAV